MCPPQQIEEDYSELCVLPSRLRKTIQNCVPPPPPPTSPSRSKKDYTELCVLPSRSKKDYTELCVLPSRSKKNYSELCVLPSRSKRLFRTVCPPQQKRRPGRRNAARRQLPQDTSAAYPVARAQFRALPLTDTFVAEGWACGVEWRLGPRGWGQAGSEGDGERGTRPGDISRPASATHRFSIDKSSARSSE